MRFAERLAWWRETPEKEEHRLRSPHCGCTSDNRRAVGLAARALIVGRATVVVTHAAQVKGALTRMVTAMPEAQTGVAR